MKARDGRSPRLPHAPILRITSQLGSAGSRQAMHTRTYTVEGFPFRGEDWVRAQGLS